MSTYFAIVFYILYRASLIRIGAIIERNNFTGERDLFRVSGVTLWSQRKVRF